MSASKFVMADDVAEAVIDAVVREATYYSGRDTTSEPAWQSFIDAVPSIVRAAVYAEEGP